MERLKEKGFLKLPTIENIALRPHDPYDYNNSGVMHAQKFIKIYEFLTLGGDWHDVLEDLTGHQMYNVIREMDKNFLADLARHTLYLNKNKLGWELFDDLLREIEKKHYIPRWELPNTVLYNDMVNEIYTTIINLKLDDTISDIFPDIISGFEELDVYQVDLNSKINSKFQVWNYKDLIDLYDVLHDPKIELYFKKKNVPIDELNNKISNIFINTIESSKTTVYQRIGLTVLFIKTYVKEGNEALMKSQELIDLIWKLVDTLSPQEKISFRTLLGATFSFVIHRIFVSQSDFITRRKILGRIISNFIKVKDFEIEKWFFSLTTIKLRHEVINYILKGYTKFVISLNSHINELPEGEITNELLTLSKLILNNIRYTLFNYLHKYLDLPKIEDSDPGMWVYQLGKLDISKILLNETKDLIISTVELLLHTGVYKESSDNWQNELTVAKLIIENDMDEQKLKIFELKERLLLGTYPFKELFININDEFNEFDTIVLCPTFEKEIIGFISIILDYLLNEESLDTDYRRDVHQFLVYFITEWLNTFIGEDDLYNEALMFLSPIVSINFVQIMREYFIKNQINRAFLTYLNMYYFLEYSVYEIRRSEIWRVAKDSKSQHQRAQISNKFRAIIEEWKVEDLLNIDDIKKSVTNLEMTIVNSNIQAVSTLSGMIEDEIIMGYLGNIQRLETFIQTTSDKSFSGNSDEFDLSSLYHLPAEDSMNVFSQIGLRKHLESKNEMPFPIIRHIHAFDVSMSMFPISENYMSIISNENLYKSIVEIMKLTESD